VVEYLVSKCETLRSNPNTTKNQTNKNKMIGATMFSLHFVYRSHNFTESGRLHTDLLYLLPELRAVSKT
jgi:hypothetical protein